MRSFRNSKDARRLSRNFFLITNEDGEDILLSEKLGIAMRIRRGGYIPKSGLLMAEQLSKLKIRGKVLDIGTGETGILANCLLALGASHVLASDIDPQAIQWAQQASNMSLKISWINCDLFPDNLTDGAFNTIVSNPPQMPMPYQGHPHDYGGADGRSFISRIVKNGKRLLCRDGKLILLCFDFLGIEHVFGQTTIIDLAQTHGLRTKIIARHRRIIRKGGKTEENISWIETICPGYSFQRDTQGNYYHEVLILEMSHDLISS